MKASGRKTVLMRVQFSGRNSARPVLEDVERNLAVAVNILRGRITQEDASFELEVTGPPQRIRGFIRLSDTWQASVGTSSVEVA